jgi:putative membrane-bound dehydrogenase-like protein
VFLWSLAVGYRGFTAIPQTLPGWTMELVAEAPRINHPSVVCTAPDGRIFVAEDPMDIRTPRADATEGRILCLHPDGRITVFAEKLYAVFGLQYLEGKLYALHNPKFSVFTDDNGVGKNRVDLIEQTNPQPWALDWNDHVPANFRLGMDGYFYVAVGDKGLHGAVGRDGSRVELRGGGILRLRPDGTQLEIFARGMRNIMDVALNAEDELFTYDNTDEHDWMGRLTHMVERGFYGYPHDFIPRRPYTLWMMHDFGGGAATGAECYAEDNLPAAYHGNLFLGDFGKRQVLRVAVERDGATYRVVKSQEMFPNPPEDFRPVGLAWSADGLGLFICDWAHRDTKENVKVGRLWKLSFTGASASGAPPKPAWFQAASMGRPFTARNDELIKALENPSRVVRMTAQRRLAERVREEIPLRQSSGSTNGIVRALTDLLSNTSAAGNARIHAIWTLDAIDEGKAVRTALVQLARSEPDQAVRRQAIRQLSQRRAIEAAEPLQTLVRDFGADASLRFHAATALGRIGATSAIPALAAALDQLDVFSRYAAFTALNEVGRRHPDAWAVIATGLTHTNERIRTATAYALRETHDIKLVSALADLARGRPETNPIPRTADSAVRETALRLLASMHHKLPEWRGEWWAYHPALAPPPPRTVEWPGTKPVLDSLANALNDDAPKVRLAAVEGLQAAAHRPAGPDLQALFVRETNSAVRCAILRTVTEFEDPGAAALVAGLLRQPPSDETLVREAIRAASVLGGKDCTDGLVQLVDSRHAARVDAIAALGRLQAAETIPTLAASLGDTNSAVRLAAIQAIGEIKGAAAFAALRPVVGSDFIAERRALAQALGRLQLPEAVPLLLQLWLVRETRSEALEGLVRRGDVRALDAYLEGLASANPGVRERCRKALAGIREEVLSLLERRATTLPPAVIAELREVYREHNRAKQGPLFAAAGRLLTPEDYARFAVETPGDAMSGQRLFWDESGVACIRCHIVAGHGSTVGPDLTTIGAQFPRRELIEQVLYPSRAVREGYQQVQVDTKEGASFSGIIASETADTLTLRNAQGELHVIVKAAISRRAASSLSLMPESLHAGISLEQFADLIAFLESRKTDPRRPTVRNTPEGFEPLLSRDSLADWRELPSGTKRVEAQTLTLGRSPEHWSAQSGVLEHDGLTGDLWSEREFGDFDLSLEWRWVAAPKWADFPLINAEGLEAGPGGHAATLRVLDAGDSGVLLRGLYKAQANLFCYPVGSGEFWEYRTDPNSTREQRRAFTPSKSADRPIGDWNEMQIRLRGDRVTVRLNGDEVITRAELPGLPARGPIGLQHEHGRIQFRNLFIREIQP